MGDMTGIVECLQAIQRPLRSRHSSRPLRALLQLPCTRPPGVSVPRPGSLLPLLPLGAPRALLSGTAQALGLPSPLLLRHAPPRPPPHRAPPTPPHRAPPPPLPSPPLMAVGDPHTRPDEEIVFVSESFDLARDAKDWTACALVPWAMHLP
jgi:hypothetical protein